VALAENEPLVKVRARMIRVHIWTPSCIYKIFRRLTLSFVENDSAGRTATASRGINIRVGSVGIWRIVRGVLSALG
jgi:hypothetical protein